MKRIYLLYVIVLGMTFFHSLNCRNASGDQEVNGNADSESSILTGSTDTSLYCDDLLTPYHEGEPTCTDTARCDAAEAYPDRLLNFVLMWSEYYEDDQGNTVKYSEKVRERSRLCILQALHELGVNNIDSSPKSDMVSFKSSYQLMSPILGYEIIRAWAVLCEGKCAEICRSYPADECNLDPFCYEIKGRRVDKSNECLETAAVAGCDGLVDVIPDHTWDIDPDGACWLFNDTNTPWGNIEAQECEYAWNYSDC